MNSDLIMKMETEEVYLKNFIEDCLVRYALDGTYWAKFPGKSEYQIYRVEPHELGPDEYAMDEDRDMILDPIMAGDEVSKEEYYNY